jgi:hypothetical protein
MYLWIEHTLTGNMLDRSYAAMRVQSSKFPFRRRSVSLLFILIISALLLLLLVVVVVLVAVVVVAVVVTAVWL